MKRKRKRTDRDNVQWCTKDYFVRRNKTTVYSRQGIRTNVCCFINLLCVTSAAPRTYYVIRFWITGRRVDNVKRNNLKVLYLKHRGLGFKLLYNVYNILYYILYCFCSH